MLLYRLLDLIIVIDRIVHLISHRHGIMHVCLQFRSKIQAIHSMLISADYRVFHQITEKVPCPRFTLFSPGASSGQNQHLGRIQLCQIFGMYDLLSIEQLIVEHIRKYFIVLKILLCHRVCDTHRQPPLSGAEAF